LEGVDDGGGDGERGLAEDLGEGEGGGAGDVAEGGVARLFETEKVGWTVVGELLPEDAGHFGEELVGNLGHIISVTDVTKDKGRSYVAPGKRTIYTIWGGFSRK